jgi:hypothetical protein
MSVDKQRIAAVAALETLGFAFKPCMPNRRAGLLHTLGVHQAGVPVSSSSMRFMES